MKASTPPLIFLHIPKTGGQSLNNFLKFFYKSTQIRELKRGLDETSTTQIKELPLERRLVVAGHMRYGLHKEMGDPYKYISFIRDPTERGWSHYQYALRTERHHAHSDLRSGHLSMSDYLMLIRNDQSRYLAGPDASRSEEELLETALGNVNSSFAMVGIVERFDESVTLMRRLFGWGFRPVMRLNAAARKSSEMSIGMPEQAKNILESGNVVDRKIYSLLRHRFEENIARQGGEFRRDVAIQKLVNRAGSLIATCFPKQR